MTDTVDDPVAAGKGPEDPAVATSGSALAPEALVALAPEVLADSLADYLRAWWKRIRGGESGALPIIIGLIVICIFFEVQSSAFLTATNIVNLFIQAAFIILLGLAELYALILSEIDLSVGFVGAVGAAIALALIGSPADWPWWAGLIVGLAACIIIGAFQGVLITRLKIPSFVVTLAAFISTPKNLTLPMVAWFLWNNGSIHQGAAVAVIVVLALIPLLFLFLQFGPRSDAMFGSSNAR